MHGEDNTKRGGVVRKIETPPYARGRLQFAEYHVTIFRNTPVCTGKTPRKAVRIVESEKHPRMHGEDSNIMLKKPKYTQHIVMS